MLCENILNSVSKITYILVNLHSSTSILLLKGKSGVWLHPADAGIPVYIEASEEMKQGGMCGTYIEEGVMDGRQENKLMTRPDYNIGTYTRKWYQKPLCNNFWWLCHYKPIRLQTNTVFAAVTYGPI